MEIGTLRQQIWLILFALICKGVYATNKARSRRRQAAQRQEERRSHLRSVFSISGASERETIPNSDSGVDNPNFNVNESTELSSPPPYALVVEAALLEEEQRNQVSHE